MHKICPKQDNTQFTCHNSVFDGIEIEFKGSFGYNGTTQIDKESRKAMLNLKKGKQYHGFRLERIEEIQDISSVGYLFSHIKSGAKLCYIKNEDPNKVFFAAFKTPPHDDCGTAHILEHSVLCGSRKYQAKDPFNELAKGSLNTYLNALTYSDKTMYPVASLNDRDFENLEDVYLDAVFHPLIYDRKEIFMQEGWHLELEDKDSPLRINGVVYNEMKGALSDPERLLNSCIEKSLFPNSVYRYESGGDPRTIPTLSYEAFLDFHRQLYHPSNCYLYYYGNMDIEGHLKHLDDEYLSASDVVMMGDKTLIDEEKPFSAPVYAEETYPAVQGDSKEEDCYFAYNTVVGRSTDTLLNLSFDLLSYMLLESNASPLKKALVDSGISDEAEGWFDSSTLQTAFSIVAKRCDYANKDRFKKVVFDTLERIAENGLDAELVDSSLNIWEFLLREEDYGYRPKGLVYGMRMMKSWLHGADPFPSFRHFEHFRKIRELSKKGYFEELIRKCILENPHASLTVIIPDESRQRREEDEFIQRLEDRKREMNREEIERIIEQTKNLKEYQSRIDPPEILEQIPLLKTEEIDAKPGFDAGRLIDVKGAKLLYTPLKSNQITYLHLLFDTSGVPQELLCYLGLLEEVLGRIDTKYDTYESLANRINRITGGIDTDVSIAHHRQGNYRADFIVSTKTMDKNVTEAFCLLREIILESDLRKKESLMKIVRETKSRMEGNMTYNPRAAGMKRCMSYLSDGPRIKEITSGITFYRFLKKLNENLEEKIEVIAANLQRTVDAVFKRENFFMAVAGEESSLGAAVREGETLASMLPNGPKALPQRYSFDFSIHQEGFTSASKVQYNVAAASFKKLGYEYSGSMQVLKTIVNLEYLWNKVRVELGAYGCSLNMQRNGNLILHSYRDPNLEKTLDAYRKIGDFLRSLSLSEREMDKYIIGAINTMDRPRTNGEKADEAVLRYLCGTDPKFLQEERDALLNVTLDGVRAYAELFDRAAEEGNICVVGNEETVRKNKGLFQRTSPFI